MHHMITAIFQLAITIIQKWSILYQFYQDIFKAFTQTKGGVLTYISPYSESMYIDTNLKKHTLYWSSHSVEVYSGKWVKIIIAYQVYKYIYLNEMQFEVEIIILHNFIVHTVKWENLAHTYIRINARAIISKFSTLGKKCIILKIKEWCTYGSQLIFLLKVTINCTNSALNIPLHLNFHVLQ
jgi:hypothetical protein